MTDATPAEMDDAERDEFLGRGGTGVISFAAGEESAPKALPVSYGYDAVEEAFYFRLAVGEDREKGDPDDSAVTFVTYGAVDDEWCSVVATGRLAATTDDEVGREVLAGLERVHIPLVDVFGEPPATVNFEFYRLAPESLTTRKEERTAP